MSVLTLLAVREYGDYRLFSAPSASMSPAIQPGEIFVVRKLRPPKEAMILKSGDIVVFWNTEGDDRRAEFVKRLVGTPGQTVELRGGVAFVDDVALDLNPAQRARLPEFRFDGRIAKLLTETATNGYEYYVLDLHDNGPFDDMSKRAISADEYFVLGDNRDRSVDSRLTTFGDVAVEDISGIAEYVAYSKALKRIGYRLDR